MRMVSFGFGELADLVCEGKRLTKITEYILLAQCFLGIKRSVQNATIPPAKRKELLLN